MQISLQAFKCSPMLLFIGFSTVIYNIIELHGEDSFDAFYPDQVFQLVSPLGVETIGNSGS